MAISEDTAALVAAQLTVAWASRQGVWSATNTANERVEQLFRTYIAYREKVVTAKD